MKYVEIVQHIMRIGKARHLISTQKRRQNVPTLRQQNITLNKITSTYHHVNRNIILCYIYIWNQMEYLKFGES
jgi:hypothetical protein